MYLSEVPRIYKPMHMEIANQALRRNVIYGMIGIQQQFATAAPVKTGTLVANYELTRGHSQFRQYAGFFPRVIKGTGNESVVRGRPIKRSIKLLPILLKNKGFTKLVNPTSYCEIIQFYRSGTSRRIKELSVIRLNAVLKRSIPNTARRLNEKGR